MFAVEEFMWMSEERASQSAVDITVHNTVFRLTVARRTTAADIIRPRIRDRFPHLPRFSSVDRTTARMGTDTIMVARITAVQITAVRTAGKRKNVTTKGTADRRIFVRSADILKPNATYT